MIKPSIAVDNPGIRAAQKRMALPTVILPFVGTLVAGMLAIVNGIGFVEVTLLAGMYVLTSIGVEVGLHRGFSHRTFEMKAGMKLVLAILGSMAAQGSVLYWAAGHRRH